MRKVLFYVLTLACISGPTFCAQSDVNTPITPVGMLRSSFCPKGNIWVQAVLKEALDSDMYIIEDGSGTILLFLASDELEALPLKVGMRVTIYGRVDVSPVRPEKNELYAEKIIPFDDPKNSP